MRRIGACNMKMHRAATRQRTLRVAQEHVQLLLAATVAWPWTCLLSDVATQTHHTHTHRDIQTSYDHCLSTYLALLWSVYIVNYSPLSLAHHSPNCATALKTGLAVAKDISVYYQRIPTSQRLPAVALHSSSFSPSPALLGLAHDTTAKPLTHS